MQEKKISVCILVTNIDAPTGGVQQNTRVLLKELNKREIKTYVCARNYHNLARNEIIDGTFFRRSPVMGGSMVINSLLYLIDTFFWLIKNRKKYDVIHSQQMYAPAMIAALVSFFIKKPVVVRVTASGDLGEVKEIKQMPLAGLRVKLLRRIDRFITLTGQMKSEIETLGIDSKKIRVINNATEIPAEASYNSQIRDDFRRKLKLEYKKIVVFTGRLSEEKGLDTLIKAWKTIKEKQLSAHLLLLGEGGAYRNVEQQMRDLTASLDLGDCVHFLGHIPNAKDYILASDIFVLPSRTEGMSNSLVEAFACGAAVAATDIPANREICIDGENSLLFKVDDTEALSQKLIKLLENRALAKTLGEQARKLAENKLSIGVMINNYLNLYRETLNSKR